jgi:hypothetical protein
MSIGHKIIEGTFGLFRVAEPDPDKAHIFVWSSGAAEQLEAVVEQEIKPLRDEVEALKAERDRLREALQEVLDQQPCTLNGSCFYPQLSGDGDYLGEQYVDPLSVIQAMADIARTAMDAARKEGA